MVGKKRQEGQKFAKSRLGKSRMLKKVDDLDPTTTAIGKLFFVKVELNLTEQTVANGHAAQKGQSVQWGYFTNYWTASVWDDRWARSRSERLVRTFAIARQRQSTPKMSVNGDASLPLGFTQFAGKFGRRLRAVV